MRHTRAFKNAYKYLYIEKKNYDHNCPKKIGTNFKCCR